MIREGIADRVAWRYAAAAMSEDKFKELLLKIRKGATTSLTIKQWLEVLARLGGGWKVEKTVAFVTTQGYETADNRPQHHFEYDIGRIQAVHARLKQQEVSSKPSAPKFGHKYVIDLSDVKEGQPGSWYVTYHEFVGTDGFLFTSPEGQVFEQGADLNQVERGDYKKMTPYALAAWLDKKTKLKEQVSNYLGMDTHEAERDKKKPKTRSASGTCSCCFRNIKLKARSNAPPTIVLHGYERPGWGQIRGSCYGVGYQPFELSCEGTEHLVEVLDKSEAHHKDFLRRLENGEVDQLLYELSGNAKMIKPGDLAWDRLLAGRIDETKKLLARLVKDLQVLRKLIVDWKPQPLPEEGQAIKPPPVQFR